MGSLGSLRSMRDWQCHSLPRCQVTKITRGIFTSTSRHVRMALQRQAEFVVPELCKSLGVPEPKKTGSLLQHIASITLSSLSPPWAADEALESNPGMGTSPSAWWLVVKHSLLYVERMPPKVAFPASGGNCGFLCYPLLRCPAPRSINIKGNTSVLPCGRVIAMTPLWELAVDGKPCINWMCEDPFSFAPCC